jgi:PST family polysaccharide transporter
LYGFFATFCLEQILAREISVRRHQAAEIFRTGTLTALGFSVIGTVAALVAAPTFGYTGQVKWLIVVAAIDVLILPPMRLRGIIFQVEMRLWYTVAIGLLRQALWLAAVVLLVLKNAAFYDVIIARTLIGAAESVVVLWTVKRMGLVRGTAKFMPQEARTMLLAGFPLVLTTLASGIYHRIDQVMLHKMSGDRVLGPYVIAVQLTELFSALPIALMTSLFPALAQNANDEEKFKRYLGETYRFLLVIVFAACAVMSPVAAPVIELFYGKEYLPTASLLIVLIWSEVPIFFAAALGSALIAKNLQRHTPLPALLCAGINILLNLWAIPHYGALGASWATVVSYSLGIFYLLFISTTRPIVTQGLRIALWPFLLSLGITVCMTRFQFAFWWKLLLAGCAYLVGGWASGMIKKSDIERFRAMFRQGIA